MTVNSAKFSDLVGEIIISITGLEQHSEEAIFQCKSGNTFRMASEGDVGLCRSGLSDVVGDTAEIIGYPITRAEERSDKGDGISWTFYELATVKGSLTVRWSNEAEEIYAAFASFTKIPSWVDSKVAEAEGKAALANSRVLALERELQAANDHASVLRQMVKDNAEENIALKRQLGIDC